MKHLMMTILAFGLTAANVQAQHCPRFARVDEKKVIQLFSQEIPGLPYAGTNGLLGRLGNIAYLGSLPAPAVNLGLNTQRQAFEAEYQAVVVALDELGANPPVPVRPRTRAFLAQAFNTSRLGLAETTISGRTNEEAQQNAATAVSAVTQAVKRLWSCYADGARD